MLPGGSPDNPITLQNLWSGYYSAVYQSFYGLDKLMSEQAAPWLTLTLLGGVGLAGLIGRSRKTQWRNVWLGLGWLLLACGPLAFLGASYSVTARVLYSPEIGYAIFVAALLRLLLNQAKYLAGSWQFWPVALLLAFLLIAPYNPLHTANQRAQKDYAPTSYNTLRWDEWIYNNPAWKAKIPERHFQTIEQKLKEAGRLK